jgi:hypothetical protein
MTGSWLPLEIFSSQRSRQRPHEAHFARNSSISRGRQIDPGRPKEETQAAPVAPPLQLLIRRLLRVVTQATSALLCCVLHRCGCLLLAQQPRAARASHQHEQLLLLSWQSDKATRRSAFADRSSERAAAVVSDSQYCFVCHASPDRAGESLATNTKPCLSLQSTGNSFSHGGARIWGVNMAVVAVRVAHAPGGAVHVGV